MTTKAIPAKRARELDEIAANVVLPSGTNDLYMHVNHEPGRKIAGTDYPAGDGGKTTYGPAPFIDGRIHGAPFFLGTMDEARYVFAKLSGEEGELWHRREARRARIAELEELEKKAAAEAKAEAKEQAKTLRRAKRNGVDMSEAVGAGSSRRERSSSRRTAGMRMRVEETLVSSPPA